MTGVSVNLEQSTRSSLCSNIFEFRCLTNNEHILLQIFNKCLKLYFNDDCTWKQIESSFRVSGYCWMDSPDETKADQRFEIQ